MQARYGCPQHRDSFSLKKISKVNNFSSLRDNHSASGCRNTKTKYLHKCLQTVKLKSNPKFHLTACQFSDVKLMNVVANKSIKPNIETTALHPNKRKNEIQPAGQLFDLPKSGSRPARATTEIAEVTGGPISPKKQCYRNGKQ